MKFKFLGLVLVALFVTTTLVFAASSFKLVDDNDVAIDGRQYQSYLLVGNNVVRTSRFLVPIATIIPGKHKVIGYSIIPTSGADHTVSLWDASNINFSTIGENILLNEAEITATQQTPIYLPSPRTIEYGLVVRAQGCSVIIYYTE